MNTKRWFIINLPQHNDSRGKMCVIENSRDIPFDIKRIFYDYDNEKTNAPRGNHANKRSRFAFIAVSGSVDIMLDDGITKEKIVLSDPSQVLLIENLVWKEMQNYSKDSVLLILSDCNYDSSEYVRNYEEFLQIVGGRK